MTRKRSLHSISRCHPEPADETVPLHWELTETGSDFAQMDQGNRSDEGFAPYPAGNLAGTIPTWLARMNSWERDRNQRWRRIRRRCTVTHD